jgi:geranylgeranyl pyrophosphate synthase
MKLPERYAEFLDAVGQVMLAELQHWAWPELGPLRRIVEGQVRQVGKRLRPVTALRFAELHGGEPHRVVAAAASVEFYHLAALVLDDVQDNSTVRRGVSAVHTASSVSTAINVAATIRSLSYHPIHRDHDLDTAAKQALHRELDEAATRLVLGQSIDIGWHEGWYGSYLDFPYERMLRAKTGSLFGCAAAMGARIGGAPESEVDAARRQGTALGALYQYVDDYLDVFGGNGVLRRPAYEDFRAGKMSGPVVHLLQALHAAGREPETASVLGRLADRSPAEGWEWLLSLLREHEVEAAMKRELAERAGALAATGIDDLVDLIMASVGSESST